MGCVTQEGLYICCWHKIAIELNSLQNRRNLWIYAFVYCYGAIAFDTWKLSMMPANSETALCMVAGSQ